jgi:phosphoribosylformylglycinamidine synthase
MKFGVVVFPGSNCDRDMMEALSHNLKQQVIPLWHKDEDLSKFSTADCIVLPGGFSYGDYLRCGAIARFSPMMKSVIAFANSGGKVLGVCNGFQILCESGLLPGALLRNAGQKFICKNVLYSKFPWLTGKGDTMLMKKPCFNLKRITGLFSGTVPQMETLRKAPTPMVHLTILPEFAIQPVMFSV